MARKKKVEVTVDGHGDVHEYTVTKGSHLTVYTYKDGSTKLEWDDEALARDVREAIAGVENKPKQKILNSVEESTEAIEKAKKSAKKTVKKEKK